MVTKEAIKRIDDEAARLSQEHNPHAMGTDVLVFSMSQLIRALQSSAKINTVLAVIMIALTLIAILTIKLVFPEAF